ncbi:glucose 1-dehydrogenase [Exiguobacterium sp. Helios]|uniref:SDR family NAD(P)-dependent oxidoreductase n=1 Tax=unclassified Exiguobacterium TaxID=2644629 RepID=UPI00165DEC0B|nr:glucose 1-dehydrogenase [Exiguobacterium sp. Helios]QNR21089.1 glucose 1-dehydrogenase [Exiguobacterium sp. Helios]
MYLPSFRLDQKTVLVTGAGRGIGRALAIGMAEAGADVLLVARTESDLQETAKQIEQLGRRSFVLTCDVTDRMQVQAMVERAYTYVDQIDVLVNNAGMNIRSKALDVTEDEWETIQQTNLKSAFLFSQEVGRRMQDTGGSILNIASVAGHVALRTGVVYATTKAALIQMTKVLALEWGPKNIRVNAIGPWYFKTPLTEALLADPTYLQDIVDVTPLGRVGELTELVGPAVFLSSDAGTYVTGQTLFVDGGMTIKGF